MKKGFVSYLIDDITLSMAIGFVIFTPIWIMFMMKDGFSWFIAFWVGLSYAYLINSYIKFNPEEYKRKKEINKQLQSLTIEEKEKLLKR